MSKLGADGQVEAREETRPEEARPEEACPEEASPEEASPEEAADYYPGGTCAKPAEYAAGLRAFPALKSVEWPRMQPADLPGVKVNALHGPRAENGMNSMLREDTAATAAKVESLF